MSLILGLVCVSFVVLLYVGVVCLFVMMIPAGLIPLFRCLLMLCKLISAIFLCLTFVFLLGCAIGWVLDGVCGEIVRGWLSRLSLLASQEHYVVFSLWIV